MLKKVAFKNSRNITLVGSLYLVSSDAIVIMAHGSGSNRFANGVFEKFGMILSQLGYSVLAFDFSGHGESDNAIISLKTATEDLQAALAFVKEQNYQRVALIGHSLGAFACVSAFRLGIETMILIGALMGPIPWKWEEMCSQEQLKEMQKMGYITNRVMDGLREEVKVDAKLLTEILAIDQKSLLCPITCPVYIIHGDGDQQEMDLLPFSKNALSFLPEDSQLELIKGASHTFTGHIEELSNLTKEWLLKHFVLYPS